MKISQKSLLTEYIAAADAERDGLYSGYKKAVKDSSVCLLRVFAQAAKVLTQHIKDYAIDPNMQLDKETGLLINFVDDLKKKFANEVQTLSLGAFVTVQKAANEMVRTLTVSRRQAERQVALLRAVVHRLEAMMVRLPFLPQTCRLSKRLSKINEYPDNHSS